MNEVFMPSAALPAKRPPTNSMNPGRYNSDMAELQGLIAEVYECLPDSFYDDLESSIAFRNLVSKFCNHDKASTVDHLLSCCSSVHQASKLKPKEYHPPVSFQYCIRNLWPFDPILPDSI